MCGNAAKIMAARRRKAASASWHCRRRKKRAIGIGVKALGSSAWRHNGENGDISESNQRRGRRRQWRLSAAISSAAANGETRLAGGSKEIISSAEIIWLAGEARKAKCRNARESQLKIIENKYQLAGVYEIIVARKWRQYLHVKRNINGESWPETASAASKAKMSKYRLENVWLA
jgi:hypothetical protein